MPEPGALLAVCRVHALKPDAGPAGVTAIDKRPAGGPVKVTKLGLRADVQADRRHHGGELQALYAYADQDARWWAEELGRQIPAGLFGENLRTSGVDVNGAVIGERWRIGAQVVVEVTSARIPCGTFARHLHEPQWVRRFTAAGRPGAYLQVLETGEIRSGDGIEIVHRPRHPVTVAQFFAGLDKAGAAALRAAGDAGEVSLAPRVRAAVARVTRAVSPRDATAAG
ncbi:MOSC domain-containing protein [Arthrobacter sp. I2-34]|uniref:MOSC domain-containing protein n=1 Tax=Arthrobacter hankyongi TaxID=2904801 RepID=A0ABS9L4G4_9MICC|nr:MOSC domain-containing protein [Arthrobacter hankyongi]MCG2621515.1 MOSC domain-containing protein [Arthrobacter hankyongi]